MNSQLRPALGRGFNPRHWYWSVSGDIGNVFSSRAAASVPISDPDYQEWTKAGYQPTPIPGFSDLFGVLLAQVPDVAARAGPAFARSNLLTPEQQAAFRLRAGILVMGDEAIASRYDIDPAAMTRLSRAVTGDGTKGFRDKAGEVRVFTSEQLQALLEGAEAYLTGIYAAEAAGLAGRAVEWPSPVVRI